MDAAEKTAGFAANTDFTKDETRINRFKHNNNRINHD